MCTFGAAPPNVHIRRRRGVECAHSADPHNRPNIGARPKKVRSLSSKKAGFVILPHRTRDWSNGRAKRVSVEHTRRRWVAAGGSAEPRAAALGGGWRVAAAIGQGLARGYDTVPETYYIWPTSTFLLSPVGWYFRPPWHWDPLRI